MDSWGAKTLIFLKLIHLYASDFVDRPTKPLFDAFRDTENIRLLSKVKLKMHNGFMKMKNLVEKLEQINLQ